MQYEVKESGYGVTITSAKFDVVITPEAPLNVAIGESARLEVPQAINYIKSGEAEIKAATDIGISRIGSTVTDGLNSFNANATAKTTAYNNNASDKLSAYNLNAQNLTTAFNTNAGDKTTAFNNNATAKTNTYNDNATDKTTAFNNNATSKTGDFNDNFTDKLAAFDLNAGNKTTAFNNNASDKTTAFNDNAAIKQAAVDASADAAAASAASAKQWAIGDPSEPTGNSAKYWANQAASSLSGLEARVTTIESDIPAQASSSNQLADKNFVNSSIATNTANFIGTFNSVADLEAYSGTLTNNDYAFVVSTDSAGNTVYNRYKWNGTAWLFEYALNNSSFTSNQWAAINSGATTTNIGQIATNTAAIGTLSSLSTTAKNNLVAAINEIDGDIDGKLNYYGTCATDAATRNKVVVCAGFVLKTGASIRIKFTNAQTYNGSARLDVNSTGAIAVYSKSGTASVRYCWNAGEVVSFTYDGTYWIMEDASIADTTYYGYTKLSNSATSTSQTLALTPRALYYFWYNLIDSTDDAPLYSASATYAVGDIVKYSYNIWVCNTAITTEEAWNAEHWDKVPTIRQQINGKADDNAVVHLAGAETITGTKTFTGTQYLSPYTIITKGNGTGGNDEGGELEFEIGTNSVLLDNVHLDVNNNSMRIFGKDSQNNISNVFRADVENNAVFLGKTPVTSSNDTTAATTAFVKNVLSEIYPVGAIYIGTQATCPLASFFGTWTLVSSGRVLQGADANHAAGTTIEAGLPNITGFLGYLTSNNSVDVSNQFNGALAWSAYNNYAGTNDVTGGNGNFDITIDASKSNSIYGNSNTVQPPAYVVNIWQRTA